MKVSTYVSATLLMIALGLSLRTAARADLYWDVDGATNGSAGGATPAGTWDATTTNWNNDPTDGAGGAKTTWDGTTAIFSAANDATGAFTVTLDATQSAAGINFEEGAVTVSGGTELNLTGGAVNVSTGASGFINSNVGGASGLTKTGSGSLALGGTNVYSGTTNVNAGILTVTNDSGLGAVDSTVVADGATLAVDGSITVAEPLSFSGNGSTGTNGAVRKTGSGNTVLSGAVTLPASSNSLIVGAGAASGNSLTFSGGISGTGNLTFDGTSNITLATTAVSIDGTITKNGTNTLTLNTAHSYTGLTTINSGIVASSNATGLGVVGQGTVVNDGGTLQVSGGNNQAEPITVAGNGSTGSNGALRKTGNNNTTLSGVITGAGTMAVTAGTLILTANNTPFTGPINVTGGGRLSVNSVSTGGNTSIITLDNGTIRNTNPGNAGSFISSTRDIVLEAGGGTLEWAEPAGQPTFLIIVQTGTTISGPGGLTKTGTGIIAVAEPATYGGATLVSAGTLRVRSNNERFPDGTALTVSAGATFDLNGLTETVGSIAGAGNVKLTGNGGSTATFKAGADNSSTLFSGMFVEGGGTNGQVTKQGTGTLTLGGDNQHTGLTTISDGAIAAQTNTALGTTAGSTTVASGAQLQIDGSGLAIAEPLTIAGTGVSTTGAVRNLANDNALSGAIALSANSRIQSDAGTLTVTGTIKSSSDTSRNLTIGGAGNTTISGVIGDGANPIGNLTKADAGIATLTGVNAYAGNTIVEAGTLSINNAYLADLSDVLLTTGSIFNLNFSGASDTIDELFIDGVAKAPGTWGGPDSAATNINSLFSGTGTILVSNGPVGAPGDFDSDGDVDGFDFLKWQRGESPNPLSNSDLAAWKANFGTPPVRSVPEPGSELMAVMGTATIVAGLLVGNRRRRKLATVTTPGKRLGA
jgi:autotransporter-associated beta strand protein